MSWKLEAGGRRCLPGGSEQAGLLCLDFRLLVYEAGRVSFCCWKAVCGNLIQWPITLTQLPVNPGSRLNYASSILADFILPPEPQT